MHETPAVEVLSEVAQLSTAIAAALEGGDVGTADRLLHDRARLLGGLPRTFRVHPGDGLDAMNRFVTAIDEADIRSRRALLDSIETTRAQLAALTVGATAVRGYFTPERVEPGFVDRRD